MWGFYKVYIYITYGGYVGDTYTHHNLGVILTAGMENQMQKKMERGHVGIRRDNDAKGSEG